VNSVCDASASETAWLESVAALLGEKPPSTWRDEDRVKFEVALAKVAHLFKHLEAVSFEHGPKGASTLADPMRIGITVREGEDLERVLWIPHADRKELDSLETQLRRVLAGSAENGHRDLALGALARIARDLLSKG